MTDPRSTEHTSKRFHLPPLRVLVVVALLLATGTMFVTTVRPSVSGPL